MNETENHRPTTSTMDKSLQFASEDAKIPTKSKDEEERFGFWHMDIPDRFASWSRVLERVRLTRKGVKVSYEQWWADLGHALARAGACGTM